MKTGDRLKHFIKDNAICLLSFAIPLLIMLGIFIVNGIFPFGDRSFMHSDMYHQYVPFMSEFLHKLRGGENLSYSWNVGIGSNFLALYAYYLASPANWLILLVPDRFLIEFMSYMVILKIALSGFTFSWYLTRHFKTRRFPLVFFAVFYAMSGFMAAYNWNVMWLDCVVLFPLIALGLERLVKEGKCKLYCIALALCILSNYYISIMICIFLVLYFILLLCSGSLGGLKPAAKAAGRFSLYSLLAGGMAGILLIPEYAALHLTDFSNFNFPETLKLYFSTIDMMARHFINVTPEKGLDHWPNIYCGVAVLILVPLYLANRKISLREKFCRLALLFFMLVSFATNMLNFIWHGFNYPDSLPCRQSFLYIFLLLSLCAEALLRLKECSKRDILISFLIAFSFVVLCEKTVTDDAFSPQVFLLTYLFLAFYGVCVYLYKKGRIDLRVMAIIVLMTVTAEATINMYNTSVSTTSRSKYLENHDNYAALVARIREEDPDFYRFEKFSRVTKNDGTMIGYPTASLFSSTANGYVQDFYDKLGMSHSKVFYCFDGQTPLTSSLLSVRYMFSKSEQEDRNLYTLVDQEGDIYLYRCNYTLPLGFMTDSRNLDYTQPVSLQSETAGQDGAAQDGLTAQIGAAAPDSTAQDGVTPQIGTPVQNGAGEAFSTPFSDNGAAAEPQTGSQTELQMGVQSEPPSVGALDQLLGNIEDTRTDVLESSLDLDGTNPLETQNRMVRALGVEGQLFESMPAAGSEESTFFTLDAPAHLYAYSNNSAVDTVKMESAQNNKTFTKVKYHYIMDLGRHEEGDTITLSSEEGALMLSVYRLNTDVLAQAIELLNENTMTVESFDSTHIKGRIDVKKPGELILSVPYEPGWKIQVDGQKVQPGLFDDTFISLSLNEGAHTIEMHYYPAGLNLGIVVSVISLTAFLLLLYFRKKVRRPVPAAEEPQAPEQPSHEMEA